MPDDVLAADDMELEAVDCPEWGGVVYLGTPRGLDRDRLDAQFEGRKKSSDPKRYDDVRANWVAACWRDEEGNPVDISPEQVKSLSRKSAKPLDRCFETAQRLGGLTTDTVEELAGNSTTDGSGDSG